MVGNDIIDIDATKRSSDWERRGFLQKIFSPTEQTFIAASADPFRAVWRLWSMKESAYKVYVQAGGERFFSPAKIECSPYSSQTGRVQIGALRLSTRTSFHADYIFTTATARDSGIDTRIFPLSASTSRQQSHCMRQHVLSDFAKKNALNPAELTLEKTRKGVPFFQYRSKVLPNSISMTHHGRFGAYSVQKNPVSV